MRILIYGAGAVGCYLGGHFASAGHTVMLLGREPLVKAVNANGLILQLTSGRQKVRAIRAATTLAEAVRRDGLFDWIAFTMKAYDTVSAILDLQQAGLPNIPPIACFQNGVGNEASIQSAFGPEEVVAGVLTTPVSMSTPGVVVEEKLRGLALASDSPGFPLIQQAFRPTGLVVHTVQSSTWLKWSKLLLNIVGNATSAILDLPPDMTFGDPRLFAIERAALRETLAIMRLRAINVVNLPGSPVRLLAALIRWTPPSILRPLLRRQVASGRGDKLPSLLETLRRGSKRTEVAWLNGAVAQAAQDANHLAPINHALALIVSDIASGRVPWDIYRHNVDRLVASISVAQGLKGWRCGE